MNRSTLFHQLPRTKREMITRLKSFWRRKLIWHPDSLAPDERAYPDTFSAKEERFLNRLNTRAEKLFADEVPESQRHIPNIGMWIAVERAGWLTNPNNPLC